MGNTKMFYGASPKIFELAKDLRNRQTEAEIVLWERLRLNRLEGYRFKPQHPISNFIADFYCHKAKLVVEIDGDSHNSESQVTYDDNRTRVLGEFGLTVIRFKNEDVLQRLDFVVEEIKKNLPLNSLEGP